MIIDMRPDEEESPLIYGLECQARALTSGPSGSTSDTSLARFIVGTQSVRGDNVVHVLEYVEDTHSLSKAVFKHESGEIDCLATSPIDGQIIASCFTNITHEGKLTNGCSLFKFPMDVSISLADDDFRCDTVQSLEKVMDLFDDDHSCNKSCVWKPEEGDEVATFSSNGLLHLWDLKKESLKGSHAIPTSNKMHQTQCIRWSPHCNSNIMGFGVGGALIGMDLRLPPSSGPSFHVTHCHNHQVRDLDFNPNAQYIMVTGGDDCEVRFWDMRNVTTPVLSLVHHNHWIWSVRYNQFHDQLVLSCSSDSKVVLSRVSSLASTPYGVLLDQDDDEDDDQEDDEEEKDKNGGEGGSDGESGGGMKSIVRLRGNKDQMGDEVIASFDEHEDSVYCAEWSNADPWVFASLSFDGRLVINKVPKSEKLNILF